MLDSQIITRATSELHADGRIYVTLFAPDGITVVRRCNVATWRGADRIVATHLRSGR